VSLAGLTPVGDDFWVVEIVPDTWTYGSEPVYGGLCEDPCGRGSGIKPFAVEGVKLRLRKDSLLAFGDQLSRRNWLASNYFERERRNGGQAARSSNAPWLMPDVLNGQVQPIAGRPWSEGSLSNDDAAVPLGVVWKNKGDNKWQLDMWTARRDVGEPTPMSAWQWRLAWRPRNVFIAQILQFQAHLASAGSLSAPTSASKKRLLELVDEAADEVAKIHSPRVPGVTSPLEEIRQVLEPDGMSSLRALGFDELPPAGYLPVSFTTVDEAYAQAAEIFGDEVDVRVRFCRADYVAHAIEEVQHMDRIPLVGAKATPRIELLVPQVALTDLDKTKPTGTSYGWSAFVRRRDDEQAVQRDKVRIFVFQQDGRQGGMALLARRIGDGGLQRILEGLDDLGTVSFPADEWGAPVDDDKVWQQVQDRLVEPMKVQGVVGVTYAPERQPLAAVRAALFVTPAGAAGMQPVELPPTLVGVLPDGPEFTIVVIGRSPR
jgi:hypothetical protein